MARQEGDRVLILAAMMLLLIGLVMVYSASAVLAEKKYGDSLLFFKKQMMWAVLGLLVMVAVSRIPYSFWKTVTPPAMGITVLALIAVLMPFLGMEVNGSRRWLNLGLISVQPSELARLSVVLYLSAYLARKRDRMGDFRQGFLPPILMVGVLLILILAEPDFGTAVVIGTVAGFLLFIGGVRLRHLWALALLAAPLLYWVLMRAGYRRERLLAYLDPWKDPTDAGFQITQSFMALGEGGPLGVGLGEGRQKLFFLPYPHTDFIFAVIGEEMGLIGTLIILGLFGVLAWRGLRIAAAAPDPFGQYLAIGITIMIVLQSQINMAVVTGLLPTKGLTLPLLSYGGSSLIANLAGIGILWSIARREGPPVRQAPARTGWRPIGAEKRTRPLPFGRGKGCGS
jgi:cell division protein FtsW